MRFVNRDYDMDFDYTNENFISLVCENPNTFGDLVDSLNDYYFGVNDEKWVLSEDYKTIDFKKCGDLIQVPFIQNINIKKLEKGLYNYFQNNLDDDIMELLLELNHSGDQIFEKLSHNIMFDIDWNHNIDIVSLCKVFSLSIIFDGCNWKENLLDYVKLLVELCDVSFLIFVNLDLYMDESNLYLFYNEIQSYDIKILNVSSKEVSSLKTSKTFIIDKDNCIIEL